MSSCTAQHFKSPNMNYDDAQKSLCVSVQIQFSVTKENVFDVFSHSYLSSVHGTKTELLIWTPMAYTYEQHTSSLRDCVVSSPVFCSPRSVSDRRHYDEEPTGDGNFGNESTEKSIKSCYAVVYELESRKCVVSGEGGWSEVHLCEDSLDNSHRILAWTVKSQQVWSFLPFPFSSLLFNFSPLTQCMDIHGLIFAILRVFLY